MVLTQFARPYNFCSFLSLPATPCKIFVLNSRKTVDFWRKSGGCELVLGKKMCSLKFVELIRKGKEEHSVCCCCCGEGSQSEGDMKLEAEILAFMEKSQNPDAFPTRKDLEKAGRFDLIEAIRNRGGWYSFGWDSEEEPFEAEEMDFDIEELRRRVEKYQESDSGSDFSSGDSSQPASSSGRSLEAVVEEDSAIEGIEGILNRLEKERISSLGINTSKYGYGANHSSRDNIDDTSSGTTTTGRAPYRTDLGKNGSLTTSSPTKGGLSDSAGQLNHQYTPDMWRSWSTQRACPEGTEFEVGEVDFDKRPNGGKTETSRHDVFTVKENSYGTPERWIYNNHNDISTRLQHLELELSSTLNSLRSKSLEVNSKEVLGRSPSDLQKLSDAREFQENDVINAQKRLRSIRAKLAILEGKVALTLTDAEKLLARKQKKIDSASKALQLLRTTQIVWHNSASEVLLTGSFDGWTTQRKMEKLRTGVFSVSLKLYPGIYEIKFIVDGIWKVDHLRPVVHNNGHENNVLIVT
ncbi:protein PTST homolog 2, chloroplastic [Solanum lycopersicum]|uniref:AMP-activated protein kinase glycogen-binding domain-containing protein n=1 Tax=Solanum lycopersicum TaxID=4081 RepID=A0A3Q7GE12_SOLLC|nr:protein PTST homolog 2, chloroplastic [Solanum lycopersicum]